MGRCFFCVICVICVTCIMTQNSCGEAGAETVFQSPKSEIEFRACGTKSEITPSLPHCEPQLFQPFLYFRAAHKQFPDQPAAIIFYHYHYGALVYR
jgi:hypothetical protein